MFEYKYSGKFPFDFEEIKKSNILVSGTNQQGKSLCAMLISDVLLRNYPDTWQIIVFDNVGHWKRKSSIPYYQVVNENSLRFVLPSSSIIFDISLLLPSYQKEFVENVLNDLWQIRVTKEHNHWCLIAFEEFQLYAKNIRGNVSQNILRICSVGANYGIRTLGITPDMSLIDCAFIRLAQQRFHFKLGNEPNAKRRFSAYYGKDWTYTARNLDVGFAIYVNKEKLKVWKIPLFISDIRPRPYFKREKKKVGLLARILGKSQVPEYDITYGEDTWEQEDDEWTEELDSVGEMDW